MEKEKGKQRATSDDEDEEDEEDEALQDAKAEKMPQPPEEEIRTWRSNRRRLSGVVRNRRDSRGSLLYVDVSINSNNHNSPFSDSEEEEESSAVAMRRMRVAANPVRYGRAPIPTPAKRLQQLEQAQAMSAFFDSLGGREA